jgi:hypothetical protein
MFRCTPPGQCWLLVTNPGIQKAVTSSCKWTHETQGSTAQHWPAIPEMRLLCRNDNRTANKGHSHSKKGTTGTLPQGSATGHQKTQLTEDKQFARAADPNALTCSSNLFAIRDMVTKA